MGEGLFMASAQKEVSRIRDKLEWSFFEVKEMFIHCVDPLRPLKNPLFYPIFASDSDFNPRNTHCMTACPVGSADRTRWLKSSSFLTLDKTEHFSKVSPY
jgi:hypothetical protein